MLFPDETNLRHVAAKLWKNPNGLGHASVIIGAGFSKNAISMSHAQQASSGFPSWAELTDVMVDELYSHENSDDRKKRKTGASGAVSNALRIAEEYEAARGRGQLDSLLKRAIPDLDFEPGPIHNALCELPWADMLTTNYDTLLERAARAQLERTYQSVLSQQDIPTTQQPRIIKLHGSFPQSKQPFIITEEDFRTYESRFPAMVNLAQQCLAEKTCCLIGFSGDDPNFLRWSGWVRDVLGKSHMQPVYLVGLHEHSPSQKSLLAKRHVHTIDLSPLFPSKDWPDEGQRHQVATTWFIEALKALKPTETYDWPETAKGSLTDLAMPAGVPALPLSNKVQLETEFAQPNYIQLPEEKEGPETPDNFDELPAAEQIKFQAESLEYLNTRNSGSELDQKIDTITTIWKSNRLLYPGWLVLPWSNHQKLVEKTATWNSLIPEQACKQPDRQKALIWLSELAWRLEKALMPWSAEMINAVESRIDLSKLGSNGTEHETNLALELLRAFREDGRGGEFLELLEKLIDLPNLPVHANDFISQQTVLFHLEGWRIKDALSSLLGWDTSLSNALWKAKRAALLGEFRPDLALEDAVGALQSLQNRPDMSDLYTRSREAVVLWLTTVLTGWDHDERHNYDSRRRAIQRKGFDAFNFEERLKETLQELPRADLNDPKKLRATETQTGRAYSMRRYIEDTAGLISSPGVTVYANSVKNAVPWMAISDPEEALRLSARYRSSSERDFTFPTHMLAALGRICIADQVSGLLEAISFLTEKLDLMKRYGSDGREPNARDLIDDKNRNSLLRAAISYGQRLQMVMAEEQRSNFTNLLLGVRKAARDYEWQTLNRAEEAIHDFLPNLSDLRLSLLAPELITQPICGVDGFPRSPLEERDVIVSASFKEADALADGGIENYDVLNTAIERLLVLQRPDEAFENRWTSSLRLSFATRQKLLSTDQLGSFLSNLEQQLDEVASDVSIATNCKAFHPVDLLTIAVGNRGKYRKMVLDIIANAPWPNFLQRNDEGNVTGIRHLGPFKDPSNLAVELTVEPWVSSEFHLQPSDWNTAQIMAYLSRASDWLEEELPKLIDHEGRDRFGGGWSSKGQLTWRCDKICNFCNNVVLIGHSDNKEALQAASALTARIYELLPHFGIKYAPILIHSGAISAAELTKQVRELYAGNDVSDKLTALMAVLVWATSAKHVGIEPPPSALVTEFAVMIRTRREPDLGWALDIARILLNRCPDLIEPAFCEDVLLGLSYLAEETNPLAPAPSALSQEATLTDLRVSSLKLLKELPQSDLRSEVLEKWTAQLKEEVEWEVARVHEELSES
jgi:hypothetical protein